MKQKIIELQKEGKSIREISEILNISSSKCFRILHETDSETASVSAETLPSETVTETVKSRCPFGLDPSTCELKKEKKLRACDYNLEEQAETYFKDMPYWDCKTSFKPKGV